MPADDEVTSLTDVGLSARKGSVAFSTTNWSVVLEAQGQSPAAQEALEKLCRTYWRPVCSFIRRQGSGPEEAEDLTQVFFVLLLQRRNFDDVRKEKGRYLWINSLNQTLPQGDNYSRGEPLRLSTKRAGEALNIRLGVPLSAVP